MRVSFINDSDLTDSFPATLDVRTKLFLCVLSSLSAIILQSPLAMTPLLAASALYALSTKNIKKILMAYVAVFTMLGISSVFVILLAMIWPELTKLEWSNFLTPFLRIVLMINVVLALSLTSRIQSLLTALKSMRLPSLIYIPTSVMIRFIPTFFNDAKQVLQALKIRGYPLTPRSMFLHPLRSLRVLFAPLVFRALRSSDDLAMAAELKGVGMSESIVPHRLNAFHRRDLAVSGLAVGLVAAAFAIQVRCGGLSFGMH
ncbi:energy-coupling factor transporter transmembrane protein EcfT [Pseudodesulfovibrio sp. F-1]|uniref:Energy-coupling factor transporter transmembrane protein EcfT n=1 Tax=Pseudodesulfovibrio alkaliphilus TaxID=2661613 RepID=A0A7K1KQZ9_9BACT|nr:energy-coupling factor transporter transmembrane component T [Pseudodesulfovibrio alkaliphilus]MUM78518.1 energy-coupling factor transporter transmembrane protein EcfT [Pseudodesulfovibrio alkaliphilus]